MPAAVKLQSEYGDAIQVILVESQGASEDDAAAFALKHKWLGNGALWTTERPFSTGGNGLPSYALLSPSGEVVLTGNTAMEHSQIEEAIAEFVKKGSSAPKGSDESVAKIYRELDKGNFVKARAEAQKVAAKGAKEPALQKAAQEAEAAIAAKLERELARVKWLVEQGRAARAQERLDAIGKAAKGHADYEAKVQEAAKLLEAPELQQTVAAERELAQLEKELFSPDLKDPLKVAKKLRKFAEANPDSKHGARAVALAATAEKAATLRS